MKVENGVISSKEYIDIQMENVHDKLALRADDRFNQIIDRMDAKFDRIEAKFDARFNHLETRFNWIGGLVVTLIGAIFINIFFK